jgi:hypothetical protein
MRCGRFEELETAEAGLDRREGLVGPVRCGEVGGDCRLGGAEQVEQEEEGDLRERGAVFVEFLARGIGLGAPLLG